MRAISSIDRNTNIRCDGRTTTRKRVGALARDPETFFFFPKIPHPSLLPISRNQQKRVTELNEGWSGSASSQVLALSRPLPFMTEKRRPVGIERG